ncbi:MAG: hypothetical protein JEY91_08045, partial [Spirochaetaceae bacterium]|nr:hypothetical protein [Spirochaetaceae bacterium]
MKKLNWLSALLLALAIIISSCDFLTVTDTSTDDTTTDDPAPTAEGVWIITSYTDNTGTYPIPYDYFANDSDIDSNGNGLMEYDGDGDGKNDENYLEWYLKITETSRAFYEKYTDINIVDNVINYFVFYYTSRTPEAVPTLDWINPPIETYTFTFSGDTATITYTNDTTDPENPYEVTMACERGDESDLSGAEDFVRSL